VDENVTTRWFDPLFRTEAMRRVFSDRARLQGMLDFEAALTRSLAAIGIIPNDAAAVIASQCRADLFDMRVLSLRSAAAGNSAIPVVQELERLVAKRSEEAARYVHFGTTSQDAMDTGLVLQIHDALKLVESDLVKLSAELVRLAEENDKLLMIGRTWLQHAAFTTFGLKAAGWASAVARHRERIEQLRPRCLVLQLGGPVGTLAAYGDKADQVAALVAADLQLGLPDLPWHTHRDRVAEVATTLGLLVGTIGKLARDIALLSQSEIAEVAEPAADGRGGSSSMPHKQNPVGCAVALAAAVRVPGLVSTMLAAMPQEQERGLGGWQAEWETLPDIFELTAGALAAMEHVAAGLNINAGRIIDNFGAAKGFLFAEALSTALAPKIGRAAAHQLVARACKRAVADDCSFQDVVCGDSEITAHLSASDLREVLDAGRDMDASARLVARALARMKFAGGETPENKEAGHG
jgi:3-carboxy-cis,cis-muconate cycloisomerase